MIAENYVKEMVARFKEILDGHDKQLECFCQYSSQLEGWIKGELLCFLDNEKTEKKIVNFDREVQLSTGGQRVDFRLEILTEATTLNAWIELKHWLVGYQKGTKYNALSYFADASLKGIKPDAEKLSKITQGSKYLLILATANPGVDDWSNGVAKFNDKFRPLRLKSLTKPTEFPQSYFLGLLEVHA